MTSRTDVFDGSRFEQLESRLLLTGAFPSAAQNAIVYDASGNLDVAYYDASAHNLKYVQESPNGSWSQPIVIDGSSSDVGKYVTIAINGQGFPAVAYQDSANSNLKFAQYNGASWQAVTVDKRKTTGFNPSLIFDPTGSPLISYYKQNSGDLELATFKNKKWVITALETKGNVGQFSSIAINPSTGKPAVAFSNANGNIQFVSGTNAKSLSAPTKVGKVATGGANVSLAFTGSSADVGFVDPGTGKVALGQLNGKKFATSTIDTIKPGTSDAAQVLIDPATHKPSVVYHDSNGVYIAAPAAGGSGFKVTQVNTGGQNTVAVVQPGSGSIVFSTVDSSGGTLSVNTTVSAPTAPSNVAAAADSTTTALISWTDNSSNEAGFLVERSTDGTVFTTAGIAPANTTSFSDSDLIEGTLYYYRVSAIGAAGNNSAGTTSGATGQLAPAAGIATATTLPSAPNALSASPLSATSTTISWNNTSHALTGFEIDRSADGGTTWIQIGNVGSNVTSFNDSNLTEATSYSYRVIGYNATGGSISASVATTTLLATPTGLSATANSATSITLTWQNNAATATSFIIQRSTDGLTFADAGTATNGATTFTDNGLAESTAYYYRVLAARPGGFVSAPSASTNAVTDPAAPSNFLATARSATRIDLTWSNASRAATGYTLQRSSNSGPFVTIAPIDSALTTSYSDNNLTEGVFYSYRIQTITGPSTTSSFSAIANVTTLPAPPSGLSVSVGNSGITLTWSDNSISESGFGIQRSTDNGLTWDQTATAPANSTSTASYVDTTVSQGYTYIYQVCALNAAGSSTFTNTDSATIAPAAPSGLTATAASATSMTLMWTDNSLGETGIHIERSPDGNTGWSDVTTTSAFASSYTDMGLSAATTYYYRISAVNAGGVSDYSTGNGLTAPVAPPSVTAIAASTTSITLSWSPVSTATSYIIQRTIGGVTTNLSPVTNTTFTDLNLTEGTTYSYGVVAVNAGGSSAPGGPVNGSTLPAAPINASAATINAVSVLVSWANNSNGTTSFHLQRSTDGQTWGDIGGTIAANQSTFTDSTALEATTYYYQIQTISAGGSSIFAAAPPVTTVPAAPSNLLANAVDANTVSLSWTNNSLGATSYTVQRGTDGENFPTTVGTVDGSTHAFTDTTAAAGTNYYYRVFATGVGGPSDYSNDPQATTVPAAPMNVSASGTSATSLHVTWSAVTGATGYSIERSLDGTDFSPLDTSTTNSYDDSTATEATEYFYCVTASNAQGNSLVSAPSAGVTTVPSAPSGVTVTGTTPGSVSLSWTNTSHAVNSFSIERSSDNGVSFSSVGTALGTDTTYTDSNNVAEGFAYVYRIRAIGDGGPGAPSLSAAANASPAAPSNLTLVSSSPTDVQVSWTAVSTHATGYIVSRADNGGGFNVVATLGGNATSFDDTVAEDGSYQYQVRAVQLLGDNVTTLSSPWTDALTITTVPTAPDNVNATAVGASTVTVTWSNESPTATSFNIYRSGGNPWTLLGNVSVGGALQFDDTNATDGTQYTYAVTALGPNGHSSVGTSSQVSTYPPVPANLAASTASNPHVSLTWDDVAGESGFTLERNDGQTGWQFLANTSHGVTQYSDNTADEDTAYQYRVQAFNLSGMSAFSDPASATTFLPAPTNLVVTTSTSSAVTLTWIDHSSSASGYEVQRSADGGSWDSITSSLNSTAASYTDTTVADGTSYSYQVRGLSIAGDSDFSALADTTTPVLRPTGLTTTSVSSNRIDLSWTNPSATATSFQIWRDTGDGFSQIDAVSTTTYSDSSLSAGQTATYEVIATSADGTSDASDMADGITRPAGPTNLDVEPIDESSLSLTWTDNSGGIAGYQIFRDSGMGFGLDTTLGAGATSFTDTGLTEGSTYTYKVFATNAGGASAPSNVAENTTFCAAPTSLTASAASSASITLSWTDNSNFADGYIVTMASAGGSEFDIVPGSVGLDGSVTQYTVTGLSEATQYQFQVYAFNASGPSATSNTAVSTTLPAAPSLNSVVAYSSGIQVSWNNNSANPGGFQVQRSTNGGGTFPTTFNAAANQSTYLDTSVAANTQYTYRVVATDAGGNSAPSANATRWSIPAAPTDFAATSTTSTSVTLTWTPDANGAAGYNINRISGGNPTGLGSAAGGTSSYTDTTAVAGETYTYEIVASNPSGTATAVDSSPVSVLTAAPGGLATTSITAGAVSLQWNDVNGETGFTIQRSPDGVGGWQNIGTTAQGQTSYTDATVSEGTQYYYAVVGSNSSGLGDASSPLGALTLPAVATNLLATPVSATEVDLSWTNHAAAADGYDVWRSANGGAPVRIAHALSGSASSYADTAASAGTNYSYQVYAYNATGNSAAATQTALTVPGQPQSFAAIAPSSSELDLSWNAVATATLYTIQRSPDGNTGWQTIGTTSGLSLSDPNLTEGTTYYYSLIPSNATGPGASAATNAPTLPAAVIDLSISASSATSVSVSWVDNSVGATGYDVYRQTNNTGSFDLVDTISDPAITSFNDAVSEGTAYTYRVFAVDISGQGPANDISITTVPATPALDSVIPASSTTINLAWTNNSAHATGFTVERMLLNTNDWQTLTSTLPNSATSYSDTTAAGGTEYQYRVFAHGAGGNSADSNIATGLAYPSAVTTLGITSSSTTQINLSWTAVNGAAGYKILRSLTNSNFVQVDTAGAGATSYQDNDGGSNLLEGTRYYYQVLASDATGDSTAGNTCYSSTLGLSPSNLTLAVVSNHEIDLSWTNNSASNAVTVGIEHSSNGSSWSPLTTTNNSSTDTYQDTSVQSGGFYYYRVAAIDEGGTNYMSDVASVSTYSAPDAPTLIATPLDDGTVSLSWSSPASATTFTVQHSTGSGWSNVAVATSAVTAIDSGLTGNTVYQYRVLASNASADSDYSDIFSVLTVPDAPTAVIATPTGQSTVSLNWTGDQDPFVLYGISRAPVVSGVVGSYQQIDIVSNTTSYADTGLDSGTTYSYQIVAANDSGSNSTAGISNDALTLPAAVTSLARTVVSTTEVDLTWADATGASSYTVSRKAVGDVGFTLLTNSPLSDTTTNYQDLSASPGTTYTYEVTAINASGIASATIGAITYPDVPTGLTTNIVDNHHISVQWDAVAGATSYTLQRADNGGSFANVNGVSGTSVTDVVAGGVSYVYRVKATNSTGDSAWATASAIVTVPDALTGVTATASSDTAVQISWTDVPGATGYIVLRSDDGGGSYPTSSTTLAANAITYNDTGLSELTPYKYKVLAVDAGGNSADSNVAAVVTKPTAPSALATTSITASAVDLAWTDNANGGTGFDVQRADGGQSNWATIGTTSSGTTTYQDTAVAAGTSYVYRIIADNGSVASSPSGPLDVLTLAAAPTHVVATPNGTGEVDLTWDAMTGAATYDISVNINGGGCNSVTTGVAGNTFTYNSASGGTSYVFQVVAQNATGASTAGTSNAALTIPAMPASFTAAPISAGEVDLTWTDVPGADTYTIERALGNGAYGPLVSGLAANVASYPDMTVAAGTPYHYRIHATDATGDSTAATQNALTVPAAVSIGSTTIVSDSEIDLAWSADTGTVAGYRVYRFNSDTSEFEEIGSDLTSLTTLFQDTGLDPATAYDYRIVAFNATGESAVADTGALTTVPEAPTGLSATGVSASEIDLAWTDSAGATGYEVDRQNQDLSWGVIAPSLPDNAAGYHDTALTAGSTYVYRVEAIDAGGSSAPTGTQSGLTTPAVPTHVVATPNGTGEVDLTWDAMTSATTYDISVNINGGGYNSVTTGLATTSYAYGAAAPGTSYVFQIVANNASGPSNPGTSNTALTIPAVPGSFTATPINAGEIDLAWTDVAGAASYTIERALGNGAFGPLVAGLASNATSYPDTTVAPATTYHYRIHAVNSTGSSATTTQSALTVPAAVNITSATVLSYEQIAVVWSFDSGTIDGYRAYREDDNSGTFVQVGLDMTNDTSAYEDVGLTSATPYVYRIVAFNASGESAPSDTAMLTTVPQTPTGFTATGVSSSEVDLSWTDSAGATGYEVDKQNSDLSWSSIADSLSDSASGFYDTGLAAGTSYTYRVEALDDGGASLPAGSQTGLTIPAAPTHVVATPNGTGEVDLTWDAMTGADNYDVSVNINGGGFNPVTTGLSGTSYAYSASPGTSYVFQIFANDASGASAAGTSNAALTIPAAPGSFTATPINAGEVDLNWADVAGAASYTIERQLGNAAFGPLVSGLGPGVTSYQDSTVYAGTQYHYRIHATDATGDSALASQSALTIPATVSITTSTIVSDSEIDLAWSADLGTVDGYRVYREDNNSGSFQQVGSDLSSATLGFNDSGLTPGTAYVYRVVAFDATGESADNDTATLTVLPATPTGFAVSSISNSEIDLSWGDVNGATHYEVDRYNGTTWDDLDDTLASNATSYQDTGLASGINFIYRVEASDVSGSSIPTASMSTYTRPDVVGNFTTSAASSSAIDVNWDSANGATGYRIMRSVNGDPYTQFATTPTPGYQNTGLDEGTDYSYEIIAYDNGGDGDATGAQDAVTYLDAPDFVSTAATSTGISLRWTNHSAADTSYEIDQYINGNWVDVHDGGAIVVDGNTGSATVGGLTEATLYQFQVTALGPNATASIPQQLTIATAPNDPTGLTAQTFSPTEIDLTWNNNSANADYYSIERSDAAGDNWMVIDTTPGNAGSYTDSSVTEATTYQYRVAAVKGSSVSAYSTIASPVTTYPLSPTGLTATAVSATEIDLSWTNRSANPTAYRIYRAEDGFSYAPYGSDLPANATSYSDTAAPEDAKTYYIVVAVDAGGESTPNARANATTPLAAPTNVLAATTASTASGDKTVELSWTNNSTVATSISIERGVNGVYSPLTTLAANATSYADDTVLENTTYTYRVWTNKGMVSSVHAASNDVTTLLSRPTGLSLSSTTPDSVTLTWNDISAVATAYHVLRSTDNSSFSDTGAVLDGSANSYTDTGLTEGTLYYYRLRAASGGNTSNYSAVQSVTTIPATPTSLTATPFSTTEIDLTWNDVAATNSGYTVESSTNGVDWSTVTAGLNGTANSYSNTALTEGTDYQYEVFATGAGGNSLLSNVASATTLPSAPSNLALTANSASAVSISWTDHSAGATDYEVERFTNGSWAPLITSLDPSTTTYTDSTVAEGTAYQYRVRDNRNGTESAYSNTLSVTTQPAAPTGLTVTSLTTTRVTLEWTDNSSGETGYIVQRSSGSGWSTAGTPGANSTSFSDNGVTEGVSYSYQVLATNAGGNSDASNTVVANVPPAAPSGLSSSAVGPTSVTLNWTNNSTHQTGFYVQQSTDSGNSWMVIANVTSGTTYTDTSVSESTAYQYQVQAYGTTGTSAFTGTVSLTTPLLAPSDLTASTISPTEIDLTWTINSANETGESLQRQLASGGAWTTISLAAGTSSYQDTDVAEATSYNYQVQNTLTGANSAFATAVGTTVPAAPTDVSGTAASDTQVTVTWTNNSSGATGFNIQRSLDNSAWTDAGSVGAGVTTFNDTGLTELTSYYYRVQATGAGGPSAWGTSVSTVSTLPAAPTLLILSTSADGEVGLAWTDNSSGATGYKVERSDNNAPFVQIELLGGSADSYTDFTVDESTLYAYRVRAVAGSINSAYSNAPSLTTVPAAPSGLSATPTAGQIELDWTDNSSGETSYTVQRQDSGVWVAIANLSANANTFTDTGNNGNLGTDLVSGQTYQYRVYCSNDGGDSPFASTSATAA